MPQVIYQTSAHAAHVLWLDGYDGNITCDVTWDCCQSLYVEAISWKRGCFVPQCSCVSSVNGWQKASKIRIHGPLWYSLYDESILPVKIQNEPVRKMKHVRNICGPKFLPYWLRAITNEDMKSCPSTLAQPLDHISSTCPQAVHNLST